MRADARRNYELLLAAAREAFSTYGTDASLRDVARQAGVGIGTLYRHFPTREALLEALMCESFDALTQRARALSEETAGDIDPGDALVTWLSELAVGSTTYRGLPDEIMGALQDEGSRLHSSCLAMRTAGADLLARAQQAGAVRPDVAMDELLALAAGIAWADERSPKPLIDRLLSLTRTGLAPR